MFEDEIKRKIFDNWTSTVMIGQYLKQNVDSKILLEVTQNELYTGLYSERYPYPVFNSIFELKPKNLSPDLHEIEQIIIKYTSKKIPVTWWINPYNTLKNNQLEDYLSKKGFVEVYSEPHMALTSTNEMISRIKNEENKLTIKPVKTIDEMLEFVNLISKIFSFPKPVTEITREIYQKYIFNLEFFKKGRIKLFIGFKDNIPISTGNILYFAGVAGLYNIGVLPEYQKHGFGKYITNFLIRNAFEEGFKTCTLQASPMGYPLYDKLGFKTYYKAKQFILNSPE